MANFIVDALRTGIADNVARDERRYERTRRAITDERKDKAFNVLSQQYGDVAGDPVTYGQLEGIQQRQDLHPGAVALQEQAVDTGVDEASKRKRDQAIKASEQLLAYGAMGADKGVPFSEVLAKVPPQLREAAGFDEKMVAEMAPIYDANPTLAKEHFEILRNQGPEELFKIIEADGRMKGISKTGSEVKDYGKAPEKSSGTLSADDVFARESAKYAGRADGKNKGEDVALSQRASNNVARKLERTRIGVENIQGVIAQAISQTDWNSAGVSSKLAGVGGTPAADLAATLETIRANAGFSELQRMRDESPTGGALGQVSELENRLLAAREAALTPEQSPAQLRANLERYSSLLAAYTQETMDAYAADVAAGLIRPESGSAPAGGAPPEGATIITLDDL